MNFIGAFFSRQKLIHRNTSINTKRHENKALTLMITTNYMINLFIFKMSI